MNSPIISNKRDMIRYLEGKIEGWKVDINVYEEEIKHLRIEIKKEERDIK